VKSHKDDFDRRGVKVVVVSFADPAKLVPYQEHHRWPFTIAADPERLAYRAFTLKRFSWLHVFSPTTLKLYWKLVRGGMKPKGYGKDDIYQSGGDFLLDRAGNILFAHRSQDPADRPAVSRLFQVIDEIASERRT
jgi:AhpC/TSA antioxidant enzyme